MDFSSEIYTTDKSNSSELLSFNATWLEISDFEALVTAYITALLSVPTNSYVIWLIVTGAGNGLAAELFSLNLAVCEVLLCLNSLFEFFSNSIIIVALFHFSEQGFACTGRPLFQCLICVERYLAVVHPVTFLKYKPLRYRVICTVVVWITIFASCGIHILLDHLNITELIYGFIVSQFVLYLSIQMFCCLAVLRALKQSGPGERGRDREEENPMKRKAFNVIVLITGSMFIIYAPTIISYIILITELFSMSSYNDSYVASVIARISFSLSGLVQAILFIHRVGKLPFTKCK